MRLGNTIRWVLALLGAVVALCAGFTVPIVVGGLALGMREANMFSVGVSVACALIGWAWVGPLIAPRRHRRIALTVFSTPVVGFALVIFGSIIIEGLPPEQQLPMSVAISMVIGVVLACISVVALYLRYWRVASE